MNQNNPHLESVCGAVLTGIYKDHFPETEDRSDIAHKYCKSGTDLIIAAMPAFNEEKRIGRTVRGAKPFVDLVVVVDDGSTDKTAQIAEDEGALVIKHSQNKGYGAALATIFETARKMRACGLVILDSDGQHDPQEIPELITPLKAGADLVIGSRFLEKDENRIPAYRKAGMKVLDMATNFAGHTSVSDSQSGFRAYGRRAIDLISITGDGMSAGSEILIQVADHHLTVAEVPITVRYDIEGTSSENPVSHGVGVLMNIIRLISCRRPLVFFGMPGSVFTVCGIGAELYAFSEFYRAGQFHYIVFTGGIAFLMLGFILLTSGLILFSLVQVMQGRGAEGRPVSKVENAEGLQ